MALFLAVCTVFASWVMTHWVRRYALKGHLMDVPSARSSHSVPTPRGGGLAIVIVFSIAALVWQFLNFNLYWTDLIALLGSACGVALIGFVDDHGHIAARWRLLGHFICAAWALWWLQGFPPVMIGHVTIDFGWLGDVFAVLYLVWLLNLYNFMDGIDGIASVEAICVAVGGAGLFWITGHGAVAWLPLLLVAAVLGFLILNFPPAKVFMGDTGSGFLGIILGGLSVLAGRVDPACFMAWLILLGVFVTDASVTLFRRLLRGEKVYEAHRSHAYQFAARFYGGHRPVTLAVLIINIIWLIPMALLVGAGYLSGVVGMVVAYVPLICLALRYEAGGPESFR
jgi:Fuc2NAc and GlcNAc transferase